MFKTAFIDDVDVVFISDQFAITVPLDRTYK